MTTRPATASILAAAVLIGTCFMAVAAEPPRLRTADSGHLVARGGASFGDGTRDFVAVVGATASGIGRGIAGPRVRSIEVAPQAADGPSRSASVIELVDGFAWMRLSPAGMAGADAPAEPSGPAAAHGLPSGVPAAGWMFSDDPDTQLRAFFPLLSYPFFLTRRVAGGAAGTELIVLVADEDETRCTVWVVYPGAETSKASAEIAFHPWDASRDAPAASLARIDLPAGSFVRITLQKRVRGEEPRGPALWYTEAAPRPAPLDGLEASADRPLITAIRQADEAARRAMSAEGERPPAGRRTFSGFSLDGPESRSP